MTILLDALRSRLLGLPAVTSLVGERIYSLKLDQSVRYPAIRLSEIDRIPFMHQRGDVNAYRSRIQADAIQSEGQDDAYATVYALAEAMKGSCAGGSASGLVGFRGNLGGLRIRGILADSQRERYETEVQVVKVECDFIVWWAS